MHRSSKLGIRLTTAAAVVTGLLLLPVAAQADACTVSVTLASGQQLSFNINVPADTPLSSISLPVTGTAVAISESCTPTSGTGTDTTSDTSSLPAATTTTGTVTGVSSVAAAGVTTAVGTSPGATATTSGTTATGATATGTTATATGTTATATTDTTATATTGTSGLATPLSVTLEAQSATRARTATTSARTKPVNTTPVTKLTAAGGVPAATNPTYSFALPGAAAVGVPNFFIDAFQIPPFLLPIYQAAGIEYNVPWQVLAAINWIETDYGRDLAVSSAGALGWMQFLPSTFAKWGVDATGTGYADPFNPTDAIFTAARYLSAAGASKNLSKAIFAYNHADWYVQSVLLRAQLIGGMPAGLISSLTNLVEGHFPVAAAATYADDSVIRTAGKKVKGTNAAIPVDSGAATGTNIYAKVGAPVIAVNDGKVVGIGETAKLGRFVKLQDDEGNTYTYAHLGSIPKLYAVPKPVRTTKRELAHEVSGSGATSTSNGSTTGTGTTTSPSAPATAGLQPNATLTVSTTTVPVATASHHQVKQKLKSLRTVTLHRSQATTSQTAGGAASSRAAGSSATSPGATNRHASGAARTHSGTATGGSASSTAKVRLFANPTRPASFAAGGEQQLASEGAAISNFRSYFSDVLHLARNQYTLAPLTKGSIVVAGTVLGRIGAGHRGQSPHVYFQIQPASSKATYIDPKPILDGWKLLQATSIYRASGLNPFLSSNKQATIGQILLESKSQLQEQVLKDSRISIYECGRRDIQSGAIDRRILATMEFLAASGLDPTISGLKCGAGTSGIDSAGQTGASMDITAINNVKVAGHHGSGSVTDIAIRRLLTLQGAMAPAEIISSLSYKGQANTLSLPDHTNRIQVTYTPQFGSNRKLTREVKSILKPDQWIQLISHISQIPEPSVPTARSAYAVKTKTQ